MGIFYNAPGGFFGAPVCKALTGVTGLFGIANYALGKRGMLWGLHHQQDGILSRHSPGLYVMLVTMTLVYHLRRVERHMGSRRFASFAISSTTVATVLQLLLARVVPFLVQTSASPVHTITLTSSIIGFAFSTLVQSYAIVPVARRFKIGSITYSDKLFGYILGIQLWAGGFGFSISGAITTAASIIAAVMYHRNILGLQRVTVPESIARVCAQISGWILSSSPPERTNATSKEEAQHTRRVNIQNRARGSQGRGVGGDRRRATGQGYADTLLGGGDDDFGTYARGARGGGPGPAAPPTPPPPPSEEMITMLTDMGFTREQVVDALRESRNDIQRATNRLLDQ